MLYGAQINGIHTINDLQLLPTAKFAASPPEVQTYYVEIPGVDGLLDLTESMDGTVHYKNRPLPMPCKCIAPREEWSAIYDRILNAVHGRRVQIFLDDDPNYFYRGRVSVEPPDLQKKQWYVNLSADVEPYKYERYESTGEWLWDPFIFATDIARDYGELAVDGKTEYTIAGSVMPVSPAFVVESADGSGISVTVGGSTYQLPDGTSEITGFKITGDDAVFLFEGSGNVSIVFRGGRL